MCELVVAKLPAAAPGRRIQRGTVLCADDPIVRRSPSLFSTYQVQHYCGSPKSGSVEQATAAPGEKRNLSVGDEYRCDEPGCGVVAKSPAGLAAHKRSHRGA